MFEEKQPKVNAEYQKANSSSEQEEKALSKSHKSRLSEIISILNRHKAINGITPEKLRLILEELGPTFIKLGQILSMRQDILAPEFCEELKKLRTDVQPMEFSEVIKVIEKEIGAEYTTIFQQICQTPLGSASIAQVHRAVLQNGKMVVIKVQRVGAREVMARDIKLLRRAIGLVRRADSYSPVRSAEMYTIINEMWNVAQQELDFLTEASNLQKFYELNKDIVYVTCPQVYQELTTRYMLTMEYIEGIRIDEIAQLQAENYDLDDLGQKLAYNYLKQVLDDGFFHADPHPGNIFIRGGQIVWLDLGMMGVLSKQDRILFNDAVVAITTENAYALKRAVMSLAVLRGKVDEAKLFNEIDLMMNKYISSEMGEINLGKYIKEFLEVVKNNNIGMPEGITMLFRGILTIQGVVADISPKTNIIEIVSLRLDYGFGGLPSKKDVFLLLHSLKNLKDIPVDIANLIRILSLGQGKINLEITGSEEPLAKLDNMVSRLVIAIIIAAALIGSSTLITSELSRTHFSIQLLGIGGYLLAMVLGVYLVITFWLSKKK